MGVLGSGAERLAFPVLLLPLLAMVQLEEQCSGKDQGQRWLCCLLSDLRAT